MSPGTSACIAYLASRLISGHAAMRIFDAQRVCWVRIGGTIHGGRVGLYDYDRGGSVSGDLPDIFDACADVRLKLFLDGSRFLVHGEERSSELHGVVDGLDVEICGATEVVERYRLEPVGS